MAVRGCEPGHSVPGLRVAAVWTVWVGILVLLLPSAADWWWQRGQRTSGPAAGAAPSQGVG
ncbi:MAG: hypothetical protein LKF88_01870, partial [Microbacteriaceae bacterium]|nr:hypothetical protein [Microbacteriaceae bacterium]